MSGEEQTVESTQTCVVSGPLGAYVGQILRPSWWEDPVKESKRKPEEKPPEMTPEERRALILKAVNEADGRVSAKDIQEKTKISIACIRQYCARLVFDDAITLHKEKAAVWWEKKRREVKRARTSRSK